MSYFEIGDLVVLTEAPDNPGEVIEVWPTRWGIRYFIHFPGDKEGEETSYASNTVDLFKQEE
jgi:hypothetical protein